MPTLTLNGKSALVTGGARRIGREIALVLARAGADITITYRESASGAEQTIEQIQKRVGEHFGMRAQDLNIRSNSKVIAFPRQVAMFLVKQLTTASLPEIGKQFGGKHHTTVLHSINKIELLRQTDKDLNKTINRLLDSFG